MKTVSTVLLILAASVASAFAAAPAWDTSGNSQLTGTYYFRQVVYVADATGNTSRAVALFGNIAFSGTAPGTYTLSGVTQQDSGGGYSISATGSYSLSASGYGFMSDPSIPGANLNFLMSKSILIGSSTESGNNDMFVAALATTTLTNASLSGSYTISGFFPGGSPATTTDLNYQINPNGAGSLGTVSLSGTTGAGTNVTQTSSGVTYKFSSGAAVINFPTNNNASFYSGVNSIFMYVSPDSDFVFGGSPSGYDMFVGVKNASSGASTPLSGLYYEAGLDDNTAAGLDSYYGSFNAFQGNIIGHERILYSGGSAEGFTYYSSYPTNLAGSYQDSYGTTKYTVGANGFRVGAGIGASLSIEVAIPYTPPAVSASTYVDPTGVVNTASSAPYTAGVSPGDFITLYNGVGLAGSTVFAPPGAFPTTLGGVKVLVDGIAAPLYYVSGTQVSFLVPYSAFQYSIGGAQTVASIQVNNNGALSNIVTTYVHQTSPGVFTSDPVGGDGVPAMLDFPSSGGYYIVTNSRPAGPGDTVALYLTGLGTPVPSNGDGALGGTSCVSGSCLLNDVAVDVGGLNVGTLAFAGLAPGLAGLYQINFQVPPICVSSTSTSCLPGAGSYTLGISGQVAVTGGNVEDSYSNEALLPVSSASAASARAATGATPAKALPAARRAPPRLRPASR